MQRPSRLIVACMVAFAGLVIFLLSGGDWTVTDEDKEHKRSEPVYEVMKRIRNVTPDNIVQPPKIESEYVERLPAIEPPPPPPKPPKPEKWSRPIVLAAGIIKSGKRIIELADIVPVALDEICEDIAGDQWPCGMLARTEMRMFVRGRAIDCNPVDDETAERISTRCRLASTDMSAWLVQNGWAKPEGGEFKDELEEAKIKNRGIWRDAPKP